MNKAVIRFILSVLDSDEGITQEGYDALAELSAHFPDTLTPIMDRVHANGNFYIPEYLVADIKQIYGLT